MRTEDIHVGDSLPQLVVSPVDGEKMKLMSALMRDPNPIHFDVESVRALGMGDRTINQGPANLSYLLAMVTDWSGAVTDIRDVAVRFLGNVFAGDRLICEGTVREIDRASGRVILDVAARVEDRPVLGGSVTVQI